MMVPGGDPNQIVELSRRIVDAPGYVEAWMDGLSELEAAFASLGDEWSAIKRSEAAYLQASGQLLDRMTVEQQSLRLEGKWLTGPADLLGVIGRGRRETYHCAGIRPPDRTLARAAT
jgi:hypothetical protein